MNTYINNTDIKIQQAKIKSIVNYKS